MRSERIEILQDAGLINETAAGFADRTGGLLIDRFPKRDEEVNGFITHLALSTQRILNGESVEEADDRIWDEVRNCEQYRAADELLH